MQTFILTLLSLIAFAANSIICRVALGQNYIDAFGFTIVRLLSGAVALYVILVLHQYAFNVSINKLNSENKDKQFSLKTSKGSWLASAFLFIYALSFSYAYGYLDTGTGALILFAVVQISMVLSVFITGKSLLKIEWLGLSFSCIGFVYLVLPDLTKPSFLGFILMALSGIAWAGYTLLGKNSKSPLMDTCYNFFRTIPFIFILMVITVNKVDYSYNGIILAVLSGALMSGVGYVIWYYALKGLTTTKAGILQLLVPVFAALGGIVFMNEVMTLRFQLSSIMVLGGIAIVLFSRELSKKLNCK